MKNPFVIPFSILFVTTILLDLGVMMQEGVYMIVYNRPETEYRWEFEVVLPTDDRMYLHIGYYENGFEAFAKAEEMGALVIHDVRVAHKERKVEKMAYTFECPANDWLCPYFDNGNCTLEDSKNECDVWYGEEGDE